MTSGILRRRVLWFALPALASACGGYEAVPTTENKPASLALPNDAALPADRIVLRAWEDTRVGLPPLAVTRADSVDNVLAFVRARADGWHEVDALPGIALPAEFYSNNQLTMRFGILDLPGDSGYFITWDGSRKLLRPASDGELWEFLGFFGIGRVLID